jgi:hypothetical protein
MGAAGVDLEGAPLRIDALDLGEAEVRRGKRRFRQYGIGVHRLVYRADVAAAEKDYAVVSHGTKR